MDGKSRPRKKRPVPSVQAGRPAIGRRQDRLRVIFEKSGMLLYDYDLRTGKIVWSGDVQKMTGFRRAEFSGVNIGRWSEMIYPGDRAAALNALEEAKRAAGAYNVEYRFLRKDGSYAFIEDHGIFLNDRAGQAVRMLGTMRDISDRKQAEQQYLDIFENAPDGIFQSLPEGRYLRVNPAMARIYGYDSPQEMVASVTDIALQIYVDPRERRSFLRQIHTRGQVERFYARNYRKDGTIIRTSTNARAVYDARGKVKYYEGFIRDITERIQAEEALRASEEKYRTLFSNSALAIGIRTIDGDAVEFNDAYVDLLGYSRDELKSMKVIQTTHPEDVPFSIESMKKVADGKTELLRYEKRYLHKNGTVIWGNTSIQPLKSADGKIVALIGTVTDITERKRAEEALHESEHRFRDILEKIRLVSVTLDETGRVTFANDFLLELLGMERGNLLGQDWFDACLPPDDRQTVRNYFLQLLASDSIPSHFENEIVTQRGEHRLIVWSNTTLRDPAGKVIGTASIGEDVTERKRAEAALLESESRLRHAQQVARLGHYRLDVVSGRWESSELLDEIFGIDANFETDIDGWAKIIHPKDRQDMLTYFQKEVIEKRRAFDREYRIRRVSDRQDRWVHGLGRLELDADGRPVCMIGTIQDITERRLADESLRIRTAELEALFNVSTALRAARTIEEMMPLVLTEVHRAFSADASAIVLLNPDQASFTIALADGLLAGNTGRHFRAEENLCGEVLRTRRPIITQGAAPANGCLPDLPGGESLGPGMIVPILSESELMGVLATHHARGGPGFTPEEVRLLSAVGEIVGNSLRRARLYNQAIERLEHVQALHHIDLAITASIDPHVTLDILLGEVVTQLKIDAADVLLYNPSALTLEYTAGRGLKQQNRKQVRIGEGLAGRIASERRQVGFSNLSTTHASLAPPEQEILEGFAAYYGIPMIAKGQIIGVLETFQRTPLEMTPEQVEFLEAVAAQAAIAIDSARLFNKLQRANLDLSLAYDATIAGWSRALDLREHETERHSDRVTDMTMQLARAASIIDEDMIHLRRGALLHDIGKMGIPDSVLLKPGRLSLEERLVMRQHPVFAYEMLSTISYLRPALDIPYAHHEKWDGTGYPRRLTGDEIPLAARLFAIVDVYDALTNDRPYRSAWPKKRALDYIRSQSGKHFDPQVVELFLKPFQAGHEPDE